MVEDRIFIENLHLECVIGVTEEERSRPQEVILDISLVLDLRHAAASSSLDDTVNYKEAMQRISALVSGGEFMLLESLVEKIATSVLEAFKVERVVVRARKAKYSGEPSIGIQIERTSEDTERKKRKRKN
jgi:7,8-dihydroneopterin aldolase/epimerase/oxygenase